MITWGYTLVHLIRFLLPMHSKTALYASIVHPQISIEIFNQHINNYTLNKHIYKMTTAPKSRHWATHWCESNIYDKSQFISTKILLIYVYVYLYGYIEGIAWSICIKMIAHVGMYECPIGVHKIDGHVTNTCLNMLDLHFLIYNTWCHNILSTNVQISINMHFKNWSNLVETEEVVCLKTYEEKKQVTALGLFFLETFGYL